MLRQEKQQFAPKLLRQASWRALFSLAWMQLALAGHQFEHSPTYSDSCDICVQFDRLDDVVADSVGAGHATCKVSAEPLREQAANEATAAPNSFDARAPPGN